MDLYYWFDKSSKQKSILKEYYDFCDQDYQQVIKYISTWWLCSEHCVNCELKKYPSLQSYFMSDNEKDMWFFRLSETFSDIQKLTSKFIKPDVIWLLKDNKLSFSKLANQKDDVDLTIGNITKPQLHRALDKGDISQNNVNKLYDTVREFYETAYTYCVKWLKWYCLQMQQVHQVFKLVQSFLWWVNWTFDILPAAFQ